MTDREHSVRSATKPGSVLVHWVLSIACNAVLPFVTYGQLTGHGWEPATAWAASACWPLVELGLLYAATRRIDEFSIFALLIVVIGVLSSLAFHSLTAVQLQSAAVSALFGLAFLASLLAPRPLAFYFGRKFATDGSTEKLAWWNGLWQYPGFRRTQRMVTTVWGVAFVLMALAQAGLTRLLSAQVMVSVGNIGPLAITAVLVMWTISYSRHKSAQGAARAAAGRATDSRPAGSLTS